jgi:hypothetical protein
LAIGKTHGQNAIATFAETEISLLNLGAMREILGNDASRVVERILSLREANSVLGLIRQILS